MSATTPLSPTRSDRSAELNRLAVIIGLGWFGTNIGLALGETPLKFVLKDQLHLTAQGVAGFFFIGQFFNYIKPIAGMLTDCIPLFRTRRRWYLILSLLVTGLGWLFLPYVPQTRDAMLVNYTILYIAVVFTSTSLGGVMVETGMKYGAEGRLTAQRIAMFRVGTLLGNPIAGWLATLPFYFAAGSAAFFHLALIPLYLVKLPEKHIAEINYRRWEETKAALRRLVSSRLLIGAAFMIFLIAASPGFNTPLLFFQTNELHFSKPFIGMLGLIESASGLAAAVAYHAICRKWSLKRLVGGSILVHAIGTLVYLFYHSHNSAIVIHAIGGVSATLAMLPVYDLAIRGTPKGCEALGYAVMMSVWNLTHALSDWTGASIFTQYKVDFSFLVWLNAGTTLLALIAIPFLPAALILRKDGYEGEAA